MNNERYLIIGSGRTGSTLKAAIMADAGGQFDLPQLADWNPRKGAYEHPLLHKASRWSSRAQKITDSMWPDRLGRKYCERLMETALAEVFEQVQFAKSTSLVWMVPIIHRLGYLPRIIISFRDYRTYFPSHHLKSLHSMPEMIKRYTDAYRTALLQIHIFGGCVISYEDITDERETEWASTLSALTGLDETKLLTSRQKRVDFSKQKPIPAFAEGLVSGSPVPDLYQTLKELQGQVFESDYLG